METKDVIAALRTRRGLSQEQLAERLHVTRQAVSRWETGAADPSTSNLIALAKLYGVSAEELLRRAAARGRPDGEDPAG